MTSVVWQGQMSDIRLERKNVLEIIFSEIAMIMSY